MKEMAQSSREHRSLLLNWFMSDTWAIAATADRPQILWRRHIEELTTLSSCQLLSVCQVPASRRLLRSGQTVRSSCVNENVAAVGERQFRLCYHRCLAGDSVNDKQRRVLNENIFV